MELELISQLTGTGADAATMLISYVLFRHEIRIQTLEGKNEKGAN
ncbi:hypothetical protein [Marinomonas algicola]|nr:hypothetical protein [Marinomonas algicola]